MPIQQSDFDLLRKWAKEKAAVDLSPAKVYLVETRLEPIAKTYGLKGLSELAQKLKTELPTSGLYKDCIDAITTHETSFFRDMKPFEYMRHELFPALLNMEHKHHRLGIWSAACSTGQEIYTVAMIIREHFPQLLKWRLDLYATDISEKAIEKAREGKFSRIEISRGLPQAYLNRYFEPNTENTSQYALKDDVKRMVRFSPLNLIGRWPQTQPFHVILLRNVLIYFDTETKKQILDKLKVYLHTDGILILGASETISNIDHEWDVKREHGVTIFRLKGI